VRYTGVACSHSYYNYKLNFSSIVIIVFIVIFVIFIVIVGIVIVVIITSLILLGWPALIHRFSHKVTH